MSTALAYLVVFVAAATPWLEVLVVVPAGVLAGLPPVPVVLVAVLGNLASLVPVVAGGHWVRARLRARADTAASARPADAGGAAATSPPAPAGRQGRARRLLDRYGVPGLAALGPLLTGIHLAAVAALATGADRRRVLGWLSAGVVVWAVAAAVLTALGIDTLVDRESLPDLGLR